MKYGKKKQPITRTDLLEFLDKDLPKINSKFLNPAFYMLSEMKTKIKDAIQIQNGKLISVQETTTKELFTGKPLNIDNEFSVIKSLGIGNEKDVIKKDFVEFVKKIAGGYPGTEIRSR